MQSTIESGPSANPFGASPFLIKVAARAVEAAGVNSSILFTQSEFDQTILSDADARVSEEQVAAVWACGAILTADPCFGISCANVVDPLAEHLLFYVLGTCKTLADAVTLAHRYQSLVHQATRFEVTIGNGLLQGRLVGADDLYTIGSAQFGFALFVRFASAATGTNIVPNKVTFKHMAPSDIAPYTRCLGSAVSFEQAQNEFVFDASILELPIRTADAALQTILTTVAEKERRQSAPVDVFRQRLDEALRASLPTADASIERIASRMSSSARTIQRRLRERGTTFFDELEAVRKETAQVHLAQPGVSISQVAFLLGFSDMTSFSRAFARWFGYSPREWRKRQRV